MHYTKYTLIGSTILFASASPLFAQENGISIGADGSMTINTQNGNSLYMNSASGTMSIGNENVALPIMSAMPVYSGAQAIPLPVMLNSITRNDITNTDRQTILTAINTAQRKILELGTKYQTKTITADELAAQADTVIMEAMAIIKPFIQADQEESFVNAIGNLKQQFITLAKLKSTIGQDKTTISDNKNAIEQNIADFHGEFDFINSYLKKGLTSTEKQTIKEILDKKTKEIREWQNAYQKQLTTSGSAIIIDTAALQVIFTDFKSAVDSYINPEKKEAFIKFVDQKIALLVKNATIRQKNQEIRETIKNTKETVKEKAKEVKTNIKNTVTTFKAKLLSQKIIGQLDKKLSTIADEKKAVAYERIVSNIEILIAKTSNEKKIALLKELKSYIIYKKSQLQDTLDETETLKNILDGVDGQQ